MKLFERREIDNRTWLVVVPGGYVYHYVDFNDNVNITFVPFDHDADKAKDRLINDLQDRVRRLENERHH